MASKKILIITNSYPSIVSREKNFIKDELKALIAEGHDVSLMPLRLKGLDKDCPPSIRVITDLSDNLKFSSAFPLILKMLSDPLFLHEVGANFLKLTTSWTRFKNLIKFSFKAKLVQAALKNKNHFDVIYTYWCTGEAVGAVRYKDEMKAATSIQSRAHGYDINEDRDCNKNYMPYRGYLFSKLDRIILLSEQAKAYIESKYPSRKTSIIVSPLGVKTQDLKMPVYYDAKKVHFFSCSYPDKVKRLPFIAEVLNKVADAVPNKIVDWTHYGSNKEEAGVNDENISANFNIRFMGRTTPDVFIEAYKDAVTPIFINLSSSEGQPVTIMEAMSCGLPVVACDVGGVAEQVGEGGIIMPATADAEFIAQKILDLMSDRQRYAEMSASALHRQQTVYDSYTNYTNLARSI